MQRLYLMRHGHAPTKAEAGVAKDALRPLSEQGRKDVRLMAAALKTRGAVLSLILHSPLLRAVQTAAEVSAILQPSLGAEVFAALDNTRTAEEVERALAARAACINEVLAIGHQPQISELAAFIGDASFEMRPAAIVALALSPVRRVLWTLSPEQAP